MAHKKGGGSSTNAAIHTGRGCGVKRFGGHWSTQARFSCASAGRSTGGENVGQRQG